MSSDFWKKFPVIPGFDCLKMKHDIQAKIHEDTMHMTQEQALGLLPHRRKETCAVAAGLRPVIPSHCTLRRSRRLMAQKRRPKC